ncbi:LacI family transcriptional regulator [Enterococcus ureilyticus]|uniref:LacI family transcriptional regulator n=1 Tax=Enterococcus ureilyticus TaxID=1131292 RepID=A0A1E5HDZ0_9ENTE|nr:LacI family DNA-binding transcriptional regulator [Enterococcus ureilyticus]MBM7689970.1 DNA-binding LacI/PurR family transcriptional regulator [Enterococcus ureilyticus]OEG23066.1 LacI family transcriptional regulator [Enterococcus ureilyticus]
MATIKDVAKKAGLSVSTVSRFLNHHPYISDDKKERIQQAMDELNYAPSAIATQLRSKKCTTIGVLISRITNPFFSYLVDAIEKQAKEHGYQLLIMQTYDDPKAELKMLEYLKQQVVAGVIMTSIESDSQVIEDYSSYGPIVLCNEKLDRTEIPNISTNQEAISYEATNYLIQKGYHKIAYCTGGNLTIGGHGQQRTKGFERALSEHELSIKNKWIFKQVHNMEDGQKVAREILSLPKNDRPDAVFSGSDEVAIGIIQEVLQQGLHVPEDLAVLGFDNQPSTSIIAVPLTTINQPTTALGIEATKLMVALLEGVTYKVNKKELILSLIERKST